MKWSPKTTNNVKSIIVALQFFESRFLSRRSYMFELLVFFSACSRQFLQWAPRPVLNTLDIHMQLLDMSFGPRSIIFEFATVHGTDSFENVFTRSETRI